MQHPLPELYVAQKQADLQREIERNNLVREAIGFDKPLQGWAANKMHDLSVWMICTGQRLHERYHATTHLSHLHQGSPQAR